MKKLLVAFCLVAIAAPAIAADPDVTSGYPPGVFQSDPSRDTCQYGFNDTSPGSGWTLGLGQQLGINCQISNSEITSVGGYFEFIAVAGTMDIVIYDDGVEVQRTPVQPVQGVNEFDVPDIAVDGSICVMFCEVGSFWAVTGEDYNSAPYGNSYFSNNCTCQNAFTDNNLTIWANYGEGGPNPTEQLSWGKIRTLYN